MAWNVGPELITGIIGTDTLWQNIRYRAMVLKVNDTKLICLYSEPNLLIWFESWASCHLRYTCQNEKRTVLSRSSFTFQDILCDYPIAWSLLEMQVHYSNNPLDGNMASLQRHVTQQKAGRVPQTKNVPVISHVVQCETTIYIFTLGLKRHYVVLENLDIFKINEVIIQTPPECPQNTVWS